MKSKPGNIFTPFDMTAGPLSGVHLIEAGAGTGKTYALTALFIRLLVEKKLTPGEILVVTFTNAATKELRGRIRQKIREALEVFAGADTKDDFLQELVKTHEAAEALRLLGDALRDFDLASIFTIHGFCQRMLREHAFESGTAFDSELLTDDSELRAEVLDDFWRTRFYPADKDFFRYAKSRSCNLKLLSKLLADGTAQPQISIVPETGHVELPDLGPLREMFRGLQQAWPGQRESVLNALKSPALKKNIYGDLEKLSGAMEDYLAGESIFPCFQDFRKFTTDHLRKSTKKNEACPEHPFFEKCSAFHEAVLAARSDMDRKIISLKGEMFGYFQSEFARRKQALNAQSYVDLLLRLNDALAGSRGKILAAAIRSRYEAALVDEFQDTDPVQYSIFSRIFSENGTLFLIGDPKQSIYGFRGADLFTYIQASAEVEDRHTLLANRRSEPPMIDAVNAVFARARNPFLFEGIEFRDAQSEPHENLKPLTFKGSQEPPFHIWLVPDQGKPVPKGRAKIAIARAIAAETARLVNLGREGRCLLGNEPLREGDIAVLVRKNSEAPIVQRALREKGIISVLCSDADVFVSEEALDLELFLRAIAGPASESAFRAALATDLIGLAAESIEALLADSAIREARRARFRAWRESWERSGFLAMFRQFLNDEKVRERMVGLPDGERRLTNYLHLGELLHRETAERRPGIAALVDWLALRRSEELRQAPEERQLRLESESDAVRVMTIHMSKGLEFPVVFCPFNWEGGMGKKNEHLLFHDRKDNWKLNLALVSPGPEADAQARMEALAENIRLMYVSMTRAKNRCYFVWGRIKDSFTSAPAYILHPLGPGDRRPETVIDDLQRRLKDLSFREMRDEIESLQKRAAGAISVSVLPAVAGPELSAPDKGPDEPVLREFKSPVERDWKVSSFSSLAAGRRALPESPDHDSGPEDYEPRPDRVTITDFPRGPHAGNFFHALFEEMDFSDTAGIEELAAKKLGEHGYGGEWTGTVSEMARNVLAADLDGGGLKLANLPQSQRLTELGFYIPLNLISPASLAGVFRQFPGGPGSCPAAFPERLGSLEFDPCRGFMRGFIDLVFASAGRFYLVDWKSNFLGHSPGDYGGAKLAASMEEHLYHLQYHLYCLALHKHLQMRVPGYSYDKNFGGVFYIYLRAFGAPGGGGIFRDRPPERLIGALEKELVRIGGEGGRA